MVAKVRKGYEGEAKKKIKEQYGSTLGAGTRRAPKPRIRKKI
jgi:hypothetical protein